METREDVFLATEILMTNRHYHGTRTEVALRDLIAPAAKSTDDDLDLASTHVLLTPNLDEAIWSAELADGDAPPRVYVVQPLGPIARVSQEPVDAASEPASASGNGASGASVPAYFVEHAMRRAPASVKVGRSFIHEAKH